jgi:hypothetical protein
MQRSPAEDFLKNLQACWSMMQGPAPQRDMNPAMQQLTPLQLPVCSSTHSK